MNRVTQRRNRWTVVVLAATLMLVGAILFPPSAPQRPNLASAGQPAATVSLIVISAGLRP